MTEITLAPATVLQITMAGQQDVEEVFGFFHSFEDNSRYMLISHEPPCETLKDQAIQIASRAEAPGAVMLCGRVDGKLVSVASLKVPPHTRVAHVAQALLAVRPHYRGKGIGTAMLRQLIHYARQSGVVRLIKTVVRADNQPVIDICKKVGFLDTGLYHHHHDNEGRVIDQLLLNLPI